MKNASSPQAGLSAAPGSFNMTKNVDGSGSRRPAEFSGDLCQLAAMFNSSAKQGEFEAVTVCAKYIVILLLFAHLHLKSHKYGFIICTK